MINSAAAEFIRRLPPLLNASMIDRPEIGVVIAALGGLAVGPDILSMTCNSDVTSCRFYEHCSPAIVEPRMLYIDGEGEDQGSY